MFIPAVVLYGVWCGVAHQHVHYQYVCRAPLTTLALGAPATALSLDALRAQVDYPYLKKRDKEMPWTLRGGSKCDLFDYECAAKEQAARAGH